jgi:hypothetical protein
MWLPVDGSDAPKIPSGKGKRLIVLHAGNREEGLIDRCDLVFLAKAKDGDYHQEMNGPIFLNWFENQLMPALKSPSVIVLDNASYHNIKTEETVVPNFNQRKAVLQDYLSKHNIPFQPLETKKQLYEKIKFKNEIEDTIKISKSTFTLTLLDLDYKYKKSGDNRRLLYDRRSVINDRCNYLRKIRKFRKDGYEIVFEDTKLHFGNTVHNRVLNTRNKTKWALHVVEVKRTR